MLFFRSEDQVAEWCTLRDQPRGPLVTMTQLWQLAVSWYSDRLDPDARRPQPDEMRRIFARIGLAGPFWDARADGFGSAWPRPRVGPC